MATRTMISAAAACMAMLALNVPATGQSSGAQTGSTQGTQGTQSGTQSETSSGTTSGTQDTSSTSQNAQGGMQAGGKRGAAVADVRLERDATKHVSDALAVVRKMETEPRMKQLLQQSKGVLIVPRYGRAALGVGAQGGSGLLLLKRPDGAWSSPAFYDMGSLSIGLQAGAEGGAVALVLNNDKAVNEFMKKNNVSLSANAGLTVLNWSRMAQGEIGTGDVVAWSGAKGLFGDVVAVAINDIRFNQSLTNAYYHRELSLSDIASGTVTNAQAQPLQQALAGAASNVR